MIGRTEDSGQWTVDMADGCDVHCPRKQKARLDLLSRRTEKDAPVIILVISPIIG
jgi:hypothetical protein